MFLSQEESQIAIEQVKLLEISNSIEQKYDIINDALNTTKQIDDILNVISTNNNNISSISTEAINLAISCIYENLGAKSYLFSIENYNSYSSNIALENINNFIKKLWEKIKMTIDSLWDKLNDFWYNNFHSLNKIKKSLLQLLQKIDNQYTLTSNQLAKEPEYNLYLYFNNSKNIDDKAIEEFLNTHNHNFNRLDEIAKYSKYFNKYVRSLNDSDFENDIDYLLVGLCKDFTRKPFKFGDEKYPIINGEYITIEYVYNEENNNIELVHNKEKLGNNINETNKIYLISKNKLRSIIKRTIEIIDNTIKYKDVQEDIQKEFKELIKVYDNIIAKDEPVLKDNHKKVLKLIYKINSSIPGIFSIIILSNVKLARSIAYYANYCLKET